MAVGIGGTFGGNSTFGSFGGPPQTSPTSSFGNPGSFTAAANTQAGDYDKIMQQYGDFVKNASTNPLTSQNVAAPVGVAPQAANYQQSADVTKSLAGLSDLATTGGFSDANIADIRARDISPTRSIYANAQENVERSKALGGGYSPNYDATQAQMARDESSQIADVTTAANAGIAQDVAANRLAAASPYAAASAGANAAATQASEFNANSVNAANEANANRTTGVNVGNADRNLLAQGQNRGNILAGIQGQTNLYGTTPALTNTFGNQVTQAANINQGQQGLDQQRRNSIYGLYRGGNG